MDLINAANEYNQRRSLEDPHTDSVDKLSSKYMVIFLAISAALISADIYVGRPLECWPPEEFTNPDHVNYIIDYCWLNNTRYLSDKRQTTDLSKSKLIAYYQWTGFILVVLIGLYIMPTYIWKALHRNLDVKLGDLCQLSANYNIGSREAVRKKCIHQISSNLITYLANQRYNKFAWTFLGVKILALVCSITALLFLCCIFGFEYTFFAFKFLYRLSIKHDVDNSVFPLETYCLVNLYAQNTHSQNSFVVSCMLVNNTFTIFIFSFLNVLQWLVIAASALNLFLWCERLSFNARKRFVVSYLYNTPVQSFDFDDKTYCEFVNTLRPDGIVILRLLSSNSSDFVVAAIVRHMFLVDERTRIYNVPDAETDNEEGKMIEPVS